MAKWFPIIAELQSGPMRWMLYDGTHGNQYATKENLVDTVVKKLKDILSNVSPFWHEFKRFSEMPSKTGDLILSGGESYEIAAVIANNSQSDRHKSRIVVCYQNGVGCTFVETGCSLYFLLHYVLVNPRGMHGWSFDYKNKSK